MNEWKKEIPSKEGIYLFYGHTSRQWVGGYISEPKLYTVYSKKNVNNNLMFTGGGIIFYPNSPQTVNRCLGIWKTIV